MEHSFRKTGVGELWGRRVRALGGLFPAILQSRKKKKELRGSRFETCWAVFVLAVSKKKEMGWNGTQAVAPRSRGRDPRARKWCLDCC